MIMTPIGMEQLASLHVVEKQRVQWEHMILVRREGSDRIYHCLNIEMVE